jgi:hypothetical protein
MLESGKPRTSGRGAVMRTTFGGLCFRFTAKQNGRCAPFPVGTRDDKTRLKQCPGPYRLIGESLESFASFAGSPDGDVPNNRFTTGGRPYFSSVVTVPRRREREPA